MVTLISGKAAWHTGPSYYFHECPLGISGSPSKILRISHYQVSYKKDSNCSNYLRLAGLTYWSENICLSDLFVLQENPPLVKVTFLVYKDFIFSPPGSFAPFFCKPSLFPFPSRAKRARLQKGKAIRGHFSLTNNPILNPFEAWL